MGDFFNIGDQAIGAARLGGIGWIFAFLTVGACLLTGSWLINWQVKRIERILAPKGEPEAAPDLGNDSSGSGTNKTP